MGHAILNIVGLALKVVIGLAILLVVISAVPAGSASEFAGGVLEGIGGTISQLDDLITDIRGAQGA